MKDGKSGWVVIEQGKGAANRAARQEVARYVLLEGARPAANKLTGGLAVEEAPALNAKARAQCG